MPPTSAGLGGVEVKVISGCRDGEGLLDLGGGCVPGVAGLVGVDDAGPDGDEGDGGTRDAAAAFADGSIEKVTGLPLAPPLAVTV